MAFGSRNLKGGKHGLGRRGVDDSATHAASSPDSSSSSSSRKCWRRVAEGSEGWGVVSWPHKLQNNCKYHGYVYMRCKLQRKLKLRIAWGNFFERGRERGAVKGEAVAIKAN